MRIGEPVKGTGPAAIAARDAALKQVKRDMVNLRIFAQQLADANEAQAAEIAEHAGGGPSNRSASCVSRHASS